MNAIEAYTRLDECSVVLLKAIRRMITAQRDLKELKTEIDADAILKSDVNDVSAHGDTTIASIDALNAKAKKVRDAVYADFSSIVDDVEIPSEV